MNGPQEESERTGPYCVKRESGAFIVESYGLRLKHRSILHRTDGPAIIHRDKATGIVVYEEWRYLNLCQGLGGPAITERDRQTGRTLNETWYEDGEMHRTDGPSTIVYAPSGQVTYEAWRRRGMTHRIDGPAQVERDEAGNITSMSWWVDGVHKRSWNRDTHGLIDDRDFATGRPKRMARGPRLFQRLKGLEL